MRGATSHDHSWRRGPAAPGRATTAAGRQISRAARRWSLGALLVAGGFLLPPAVAAQAPGAAAQTTGELAVRLIGMTAVSGYEQAMADSLLELLPGATRDRAGDVILELGESGPRRLAVCPMDEWGYVVGGIHEGGYVTLRRVGRGQPAFFDQQHEGHRVVIWGSAGPVPAVVGVPSVHLLRGGRGAFQANRLFQVDDAWVDLGASSPEGVRAAGVDVLDPVALEKALQRYGTDLVAGPEAGQRGACAALAAAARSASAGREGALEGRNVIAFTVESRIGHRGLGTVLDLEGPFEQTLLVGYPEPRRFPLAGRMGEVTRLDLRTRYDGSAIETIALREVGTLAKRIETWLKGER
ncbi:MAG: hypothetical protein ACE5HQ_07160 [Gemmatimonadota bacterium]